ncbi:MAG: hypothetical protein ABI601_14805 [bacterium]
MRRMLAALIFVSLAACSGLDVGDQRIDGTWTGQSNGQSISMQLVQSGNVTGIATIAGGAGGSRTLAVSGTFASPTFTASLSGSAPSDTIALSATVTGRAMVGSLTGSEFSGNGVALQRQ